MSLKPSSTSNYLSKSKGDDKCFSATLFEIQIWTVDQVAKFLNVTKGHIYNLVSRREIPFRKKKGKGRLYFIPQEIFDWINEEG